MKKLFALTLFLFALASLPPAAGQVDDLRLPVIIDADRTDYDGKTSMLKFTGLRLTQGSIGIEADVAHASRMDFDDSVWRFSGNVVFDVAEGRITCETADLRFSDFQLLEARISGSPATFRFKRAGNEESTYAEAGTLHYDVASGIIEFSGGATITEGGNQISSESLVYNIREQRINAASTGNGDDRVTVTYTPPPSGSESTDEETTESADDRDDDE
ncbi:MAG: LptA/OstA family protein [Woeseiaceae bacterium]|nr:LptA/OstA family protein [Woeseiaceae bacterium]